VLERLIEAAAPQVADAERISLDMAGVEALDSIGAWLLERLIRHSNLDGKRAQFTGLPPRYRGLIEEMHAVNLQPRTAPKSPNRLWSALDGVGRAAPDDVMSGFPRCSVISASRSAAALRPRGFVDLDSLPALPGRLAGGADHGPITF
jgi:ABC-type transporter Mla MlaB component